MERKDFHLIKSELTSIIKKIASEIGLQELIPGEVSEKYFFEDDIKMTSSYFSGGTIFKNTVFSKFFINEKINYDTAFEIFDKLMKELYGRIKGRNTVLDTLDKYLLEDDFLFITERLMQILEEIKGSHEIVLLTNLIKLVDTNTLSIGNVEIKKIEEDYFEKWPEGIPFPSSRGLLANVLSEKHTLPKNDFLKTFENCVALETKIDGLHVGDEKSLVFYATLDNFKQVFAFLYLCKLFLERLTDPYEIKTSEIERIIFGEYRNLAVQSFYARKKIRQTP